mmetsp:Transcript_119605/g.208274  ORF Transcript_119605/g.208274 Transcript_119605/m.208274 type:complete len:322 (+) Transcript_119605:599-1564(+)
MAVVASVASVVVVTSWELDKWNVALWGAAKQKVAVAWTGAASDLGVVVVHHSGRRAVMSWAAVSQRRGAVDLPEMDPVNSLPFPETQWEASRARHGQDTAVPLARAVGHLVVLEATAGLVGGKLWALVWWNDGIPLHPARTDLNVLPVSSLLSHEMHSVQKRHLSPQLSLNLRRSQSHNRGALVLVVRPLQLIWATVAAGGTTRMRTTNPRSLRGKWRRRPRRLTLSLHGARSQRRNQRRRRRSERYPRHKRNCFSSRLPRQRRRRKQPRQRRRKKTTRTSTCGVPWVRAKRRSDKCGPLGGVRGGCLRFGCCNLGGFWFV